MFITCSAALSSGGVRGRSWLLRLGLSVGCVWPEESAPTWDETCPLLAMLLSRCEWHKPEHVRVRGHYPSMRDRACLPAIRGFVRLRSMAHCICCIGHLHFATSTKARHLQDGWILPSRKRSAQIGSRGSFWSGDVASCAKGTVILG